MMFARTLARLLLLANQFTEAAQKPKTHISDMYLVLFERRDRWPTSNHKC